MCKRGDIYYIDFGTNRDSCKQSGLRPALIVSNNRANDHSPVITVVPMTAQIHKKRSLPTHVLIPCGFGLSKNSLALAEQVETIDKKKLREKKGSITDSRIMEQVTYALQVQIGAIDQYN